jgi:hypothetical protein
MHATAAAAALLAAAHGCCSSGLALLSKHGTAPATVATAAAVSSLYSCFKTAHASDGKVSPLLIVKPNFGSMSSSRAACARHCFKFYSNTPALKYAAVLFQWLPTCPSTLLPLLPPQLPSCSKPGWPHGIPKSRTAASSDGVVLLLLLHCSSAAEVGSRACNTRYM